MGASIHHVMLKGEGDQMSRLITMERGGSNIISRVFIFFQKFSLSFLKKLLRNGANKFKR